METSTVTHQEKVQKRCLQFFGIHKDQYWNITRTGVQKQNSAHYSEMLIDRLKPEIQSKRQGHLSKGIVLLHANAHPLTAAHTVETF